MINKIKNILHKKNASLVVYKDGIINEYYNNGIKDLIDILNKDENALRDAIVADTTVGKVSCAIMIKAGVIEIYADKLSEFAIPMLEENSVKYEYKMKVDYIKNKTRTDICPMEAKFKNEQSIEKIYKECVK